MKWLHWLPVGLCVVYCVNWTVTPRIVGPVDLEVVFRPRPRETFNAAAWMESPMFAGRRYRMANDLLATKRLLGLSKEAVSLMLGKPDWADDKQPIPVWSYGLAPQSMFPAKSWLFPAILWNAEAWALTLSFREGKVSRVRVSVT